MTTFMITMLLGWFLGSFGWMAIAAIAATVLVYAFKGRKAAAVTAVLAVAALIGWRSFARNGWAAAGGPGRQLTAKQQLGAKQARERKQWKNWNKGAEEQLNKASAQLAMQTNPMGGGMSMPYVQVPKIGPPTGAPAHSGPLFGGTPGRVTVAASQTAPVAAAVPAAAPPAAMAPLPVPAASAEGEAEAEADGATMPAASAALDAAKANAASSSNPPTASQNGKAAGGKQTATGGSADSMSATGKSKPPASAGAGPANGSGPGKAASPKADQAAQGSPPSAKRPAGAHQSSMGGSARPGDVTQSNGTSRQSKGNGGGKAQNAKTMPQRRRPHYQPAEEDAIPQVKAASAE